MVKRLHRIKKIEEKKLLFSNSNFFKLVLFQEKFKSVLTEVNIMSNSIERNTSKTQKVSCLIL